MTYTTARLKELAREPGDAGKPARALLQKRAAKEKPREPTPLSGAAVWVLRNLWTQPGEALVWLELGNWGVKRARTIERCKNCGLPVEGIWWVYTLTVQSLLDRGLLIRANRGAKGKPLSKAERAKTMLVLSAKGEAVAEQAQMSGPSWSPSRPSEWMPSCKCQGQAGR